MAHLTLASTGNGSWVDVGMDAVALVTMGVGLRAAKALKSAQEAARMAAASDIRQAAIDGVVRAKDFERQAAERAAARIGRNMAPRTAAETRAVMAEAEAAGDAASSAFLRSPMPETTLGQRWGVGDRELASAWDDLSTIRTQFAHVPGVVDAAERGTGAYAVAKQNFAMGTTFDLATKAIDDPLLGSWPFMQTASTW